MAKHGGGRREEAAQVRSSCRKTEKKIYKTKARRKGEEEEISRREEVNTVGMDEKQRKTGESSTFSMACSLLRKYLKQNRDNHAFDLQKLPTPHELTQEAHLPQTTMNLFPVSNGTHEHEKDPLEDASSQLTIFYKGKVMVFDHFPAAKVKDLLEMACKEKIASFTLTTPELPLESSASMDLSMPIARRASLHRFLAKRKDRISSNAPYLVDGSTGSEAGGAKQINDQTWLRFSHD